MTGWKIELGYNGQSKKTYDAQWQILSKCAADLKLNAGCFDTGFIKAQKLNTPENLSEYLNHIRIREDNENRYIMVLASGENPFRDWKEEVARMYVIRLMEAMMCEQINISVNVE